MPEAGMSLPSQRLALIGAERAHRFDGATETSVDLRDVRGQLEVGGHGQDQDIALDVPGRAFLDVQAHG